MENTRSKPSARSRSGGPRLRTFIIAFLATIAVTISVFLLYKTFIKHDIAIIPGKVSYDDSLTETEKSQIDTIFENARLNNDVKITALFKTSYEDTTDKVLAAAYVPVTGFNNPKLSISAAELENLKPSSVETDAEIIANIVANPDTYDIKLISANSLTSSVHLLAVDDKYYLDDFASGARFRIYQLDGRNTAEAKEVLEQNLDTPLSKNSVLSLNQTGTTALVRAMQSNSLKKHGNGAYFAEQIKDFLSKTDLTHISNEASFVDGCDIGKGSMQLCADPRMMASIEAIGTDIIELTGNHNNDFGTSYNLSTIALYEEKGIKTFGGGKDEETAKIPLQISDKNTNFTWIGINNSGSTKANGQGASGDHPGANIYDEAILKQQIEEAKQHGDFIIVDIQFSECYCYTDDWSFVEIPACDYPISGQKEFFRYVADLLDDGKGLVVGTQAHQPQTYELYKTIPIYYGLGNLFFDQTYWPGTERGLILTHYFKNSKLIQTRISPTVYGEEYQVHLMDTATAESFLTRLGNARPAYVTNN